MKRWLAKVTDVRISLISLNFIYFYILFALNNSENHLSAQRICLVWTKIIYFDGLILVPKLFSVNIETLESAVGASIVEISPGDAAAAAAGPSKSEVKQLKEELAALQKIVSCKVTFFFYLICVKH